MFKHRQSLLTLLVVLGVQLHASLAVYTAGNATLATRDDGLSERALYDVFPNVVTGQGAESPFNSTAAENGLMVKRVVWNPKITNPTASTVWVGGSKETVT